MVSYTVRLHGVDLTTLALARVVSVEAGQVANDVAAASLECRPAAGVTPDDVLAYSVTRHLAGRVTLIGLYFVETLTTKAAGQARTWVMRGASPLVLLQQRLTPRLATALAASAAASILKLMDSAWRYGDTYMTVDAARGDGVSPCATTQTGVVEPLATMRDLAQAAETAYGMDLRYKVNFDLAAVPTATGMTLRPCVWVGDYGADRRVGSGVSPVLLYLSKMTDGWEATDDRKSQVTRLVGTDSASSYTNGRALDSPYGNRREKTVSASSSGASRVNAQAKVTLFKGRPVTRLPAELSLPPDQYGLMLGDVFTVNVGGMPGTAWLNVVHYVWKGGDEQVTGRLDVELKGS